LVNVVRALRDQGTFDEIGNDVVELVVGSKLFDVRNQLSLGNSGERVLDSATSQRWSPQVAEGEQVTDSPVTFSVSAATLALRRLWSRKTEALRCFSLWGASNGSTTGSLICTFLCLQLLVRGRRH
jgi:hypothetical protein